MATKKPNETALVRQVLEYLRLRKIPSWRANAGGAMRGGRLVKMAPAGTPDVLAILPGGRLLGVEAKSPTGRLRETQIAWRDAAEKAGALYWVVRSLDDLIGGLKREGV